jgi:hypothetical protein
MAFLVAFPRLHGMDVADSRSLRCDSHVRMQHFVRRTTFFFLFDVLGGMCGENSCNIFQLLFMVLWVLIPSTLCRRAVLMLWHAFLFLGLISFFFLLFSSFCLVVSASFSSKNIFYSSCTGQNHFFFTESSADACNTISMEGSADAVACLHVPRA